MESIYCTSLFFESLQRVEQLFQQCQKEQFKTNRTKKLQKDCETRWISTIQMLKKAEEFRKVITMMLIETPMKPYIPNWSNDDWIFLHRLSNEILIQRKI